MLGNFLKQKNVKNWLIALAVPTGVVLAAPAQAVLVIDDYNTTGRFEVTDNSINGSPETLLTTIDPSNIVWGTAGQGNKMRTISANLSAGDTVSAEICYVCLTGHHSSSPQIGTGGTTFEYGFQESLAGIDASGESHVMLDYIADVEGGEIAFIFEDASANAGTVSTGALIGGNIPLTILLALPGGVDYSQLVEARIEIAGVAGLDASIDDFKLTTVPEPSALLLFGFGILGIAVFRRRRVLPDIG